MPGHRLVEVDFSGLDMVPAPPYPAPPDSTPPDTDATVSPPPTGAGWHNGDVTVSFASTDDLSMASRKLHVSVEGAGAGASDVAYIQPGDDLTLPALTADGEYTITYFAVDVLGNIETRADTPGLASTAWPPPCRGSRRRA